MAACIFSAPSEGKYIWLGPIFSLAGLSRVTSGVSWSVRAAPSMWCRPPGLQVFPQRNVLLTAKSLGLVSVAEETALAAASWMTVVNTHVGRAQTHNVKTLLPPSRLWFNSRLSQLCFASVAAAASPHSHSFKDKTPPTRAPLPENCETFAECVSTLVSFCLCQRRLFS